MFYKLTKIWRKLHVFAICFLFLFLVCLGRFSLFSDGREIDIVLKEKKPNKYQSRHRQAAPDWLDTYNKYNFGLVTRYLKGKEYNTF